MNLSTKIPKPNKSTGPVKFTNHYRNNIKIKIAKLSNKIVHWKYVKKGKS